MLIVRKCFVTTESWFSLYFFRFSIGRNWSEFEDSWMVYTDRKNRKLAGILVCQVVSWLFIKKKFITDSFICEFHIYFPNCFIRIFVRIREISLIGNFFFVCFTYVIVRVCAWLGCYFWVHFFRNPNVCLVCNFWLF